MIIHGARVVTWERPNRILEDHAVVLRQGLIADLGPSDDLLTRYPDEERLDAEGQILMPGSICAHTHFYGAFARGMAIPGEAPDAFPSILRKLWWPLDQSLAEDDIRYSALVCLIDAIRHGTTTLIDHHASPNAIDGSLDILAEAVEEAGVRAVLCYEVTDRNGPERARAGIRENVRFLERCRREAVGGGRLAAMFGLHASLTLSEATLEACRQEAPADAGFHVHVAEHPADEEDCQARTGMRVVQRFARHGLLGERTLAVHAVHVDREEIERLAQTRTWVTHQPRSNMNNGVGAAPVDEMRAAGVRVGLGNDGFSNAMWEEWKAAYLLHKVWHRDPRRMPGGTLVEMAVYTNAALAGTFFPSAPLGVVAPGAHADLMLVDYRPPTPLSADNLPWHILFGFRDSMVTTTIAAGRVLMHNRRLLTLDEDRITRRARELAARVWSRYHERASSA